MAEKVIIMGAAGRDFHNFNLYFRDNQRYDVVAFTAAQIPRIEGRTYPVELAGSLYPEGIVIYPEGRLTELIRRHKADLVVFSYSDVPHLEVMHRASGVMAEGADFILVGATYTMLESKKPVVAVCAVRTGCGKSPTTRRVCGIIEGMGRRPVVVRHPMPYGELRSQVVQRFSTYDDFDRFDCTIEEREEYEPLVDEGFVVYSGIDFAKVLEEAEKEADVIVWDGGNNDTPFFRPDVHIVLFDPHRPGHELEYYPGETNMRMADIAIINKTDTAPQSGIDLVRSNIREHAPHARILEAESPIWVANPEQIEGERVLVVEDGPTLTHGDMPHGAGYLAAQKYGAAQIVDPRPYAVGSIRETYATYPHIGPVLPAVGYGKEQRRELERTINNAECNLVIYATPTDLRRYLEIKKPAARVRYDYADRGEVTLEELLRERLEGLRENPNEE